MFRDSPTSVVPNDIDTLRNRYHQGHHVTVMSQFRSVHAPQLTYIGHRVPVRVSHVAIGESSKELAKPNLWILAILVD